MDAIKAKMLEISSSFESVGTVGIMSEMPRFIFDLVVSSNVFEVEGNTYKFMGAIRGSIKTFNPYSPSKINITDQQINDLNKEFIDNSVKYESEDFMFEREEYNNFIQYLWEPTLVQINASTSLNKINEVRDSLSDEFYNHVASSFKEYVATIPEKLKSKSINNFENIAPR